MKLKKLFALLLALCTLVSVSACGQTGGAYTIVETLSEGKYCIAFRNDDPVADYVEAALKVLTANGKVAELETRWFGRSGGTDFDKDMDALNKIGMPPQRTLIMGLDPDNFPMSYVSNGVYMGFDVELCRAVCDLLGWTLKFSEVGDESETFVHLNAGNADVVWGGMILNPEETNYDVRMAYMDGGTVLVVLAGSGKGSIGRLSGGIIGLNNGKRYADALASCELSTTAGQIIITEDGNDVVFDSLYKGYYDGIITDLTTARYYMK